MAGVTDNWKTQIRKGYLELCILLLIRRQKKVYGFDLLERLSAASLDVKEGTLYPLLNRMSAEGQLTATWETEKLKGHPRKFYSLTKEGSRFLDEMDREFDQMVAIYRRLAKQEKGESLK
jgi:PadR family transcriptional regulator, regulatory protein PadR